MSQGRAPFVADAPDGSVIRYIHAAAGYADSFAQPVRGRAFADALHAYLTMRTRAPRWVNGLLAVRDALAGLVGMTRTEGFATSATCPGAIGPGDPLDFFRVLFIDARELAMALDDRHFRVVVSLYLADRTEGQVVVVSSAVEPRGLVGKAYLTLIAPFHRQVVKSMLRRLEAGAPA